MKTILALVWDRPNMALDEICPMCEGKGYTVKMYAGKKRRITCHDCKGKGIILTDNGKTILKFLRRYGEQ